MKKDSKIPVVDSGVCIELLHLGVIFCKKALLKSEDKQLADEACIVLGA